MTLQREDFSRFFAAMHDGHQPFGWQERLLDQVVSDGRWPERVVAPTGSGKTSVIDVHVFAQALGAGAVSQQPTPPRRLAMVVGRRVVVDDQFQYARRLAERLRSAADGVLVEVAEALWRLRRPGGLPRHPEGAGEEARVSPLITGRLRGGAPPSLDWRDHPTAAAVISATPDMWGSRVLFRGYGSSRLAWPREAGLLAVDSVVVVDEAHLARQLLTTARRVAELVHVADEPGSLGRLPGLQVVETTATPPGGRTDGAGVHPDDLLADDVLRDRLTRPKPVSMTEVPGWGQRARSRRLQSQRAVVEQVVQLHQRLTAMAVEREEPVGTIGCFVNTVQTAVAVAAALRAGGSAGPGLRVVMVCGQLRPHDLEALRDRYPGLLDSAGCDEVDVLVSTQSLEVGVDIDLVGVVTELASGSALAQRCGRVNRRGRRDQGPVVVVGPCAGEQVEGSGPYDAEDLTQARDWVMRRVSDPFGLAPWALRDDPPPDAPARRTLYQRPEIEQVLAWARTSDDLAAEPDLQLWLAEDLSNDTTVAVVVRDGLPQESEDAVLLVRALPPRTHELFPVPYRTAVAALTRSRPTDPDAPAWPVRVVVRGDEVTELTDSDGERGALRPRLRPGDTIVLDSSEALFTERPTSGDELWPQVVARPEDLPDGMVTAADVLMSRSLLTGWRDVGEVVLRLDDTTVGSRFATLRDALSGDEDERVDDRSRVEALSSWLRAGLDVAPAEQVESRLSSPMVRAALELLAGPASMFDLVLLPEHEPVPAHVVLTDRRRAARDDELRQEWLPGATEPVGLDAHQRGVADRAALLAATLTLPEVMVESVRAAGRHHDEGKADPRFQALLGADRGLVLAKSVPGTTLAVRRRRREGSGLPAGWRHEQRSVAESWAALHSTPGIQPELAARLVGTSHGRGRVGFPHVGAELLSPGDTDGVWRAAFELFDEGLWDELVEQTDHRFGVWVCAFLEAVHRAADGQVSGEGS